MQSRIVKILVWIPIIIVVITIALLALSVAGYVGR